MCGLINTLFKLILEVNLTTLPLDLEFEYRTTDYSFKQKYVAEHTLSRESHSFLYFTFYATEPTAPAAKDKLAYCKGVQGAQGGQPPINGEGMTCVTLNGKKVKGVVFV